MLAAANGAPSDRLPLAPRMDLWHLANEARGTLPESFAGKNLVEIAQKLGVACHALGGDGAVAAPPEDRAFRWLGLDNHQDRPFRMEVEGLQVEREIDGPDERARVATAAGEATAHLSYTDSMRRDGISSPFPVLPPLRSAADVEPIAEVFDRVTITANADGYRQYQARVGEQGLAIARGLVSASPMHMIMHELCASEQFF